MRNDGTLAQKHVQEALTALRDEHKLMFVRFYDTKTAGGKNYIPEQPSDFLAIGGGKALFIEVKSSDKATSLSKVALSGYIEPSQLVGCKAALMQGAGYVFVFYSLLTKEFEVWNGSEILQAVSEGRRLTAANCQTCSRKDLGDLLWLKL